MGIIINNSLLLYLNRYNLIINKREIMFELRLFVKEKRKSVHLTQKELAEKAGVGLRLIRSIEQGKTNLNINSVNQVLALFGHELGPVNSREIKRYENS